MTTERLFERAIALRGLLRGRRTSRACIHLRCARRSSRQDFAGRPSPRLFGGHEFDLGTSYRLIVEIARGHPRRRWCLSLGGSHAYVVGLHYM
jgi:hypothetical protein